MALVPQVSIPVGLATASVVYASFSQLPTVPDIRATEPMDPDAGGAIKAAAWISAAAVGGVSLIAKDATIFIIGGAMTVALYWWHAHANSWDPINQAVMTLTGERDMVDGDGGDISETEAA